MMGVKPASVTDDTSFIYRKNGNTYEIVTIKNVAGKVTVPAKYNNLPVTRINKYALYQNQVTTAIDISEGVEKIASYAFSNSAVQVINVPKSVKIVNKYGFYSLSSCTVYVANSSIPEDWDSSWRSSINGYKLGSKASFDYTGKYMYETVNGQIYLIKYLGKMEFNTPIIIPEKVDGKTVYGIRSYCYNATSTPSSSNRYVFVISPKITVMESYAIYIPSYGYSDLYMDMESSGSIPSTWNSSWFYASYGYNYNNYRNNIYYSSEWELIDNAPTLK